MLLNCVETNEVKFFSLQMTLLTCVTVLLTNNNTPFITKYKNMDLKKHFLSRKRTRSFDKKKFEHGSLVFKSLFFTQKL